MMHALLFLALVQLMAAPSQASEGNLVHASARRFKPL
jgi:hypothetical protein